MKIVCLSVGKRHDTAIATAVMDYTQRIQRYVQFEWQIVPPAKGKMSVDEIKRAESAAIAARFKDDDYIVLLDERGTQLTSNDLAGILDMLDMQVSKRIVFVIGGAYGVTDGIMKRADFIWALSRLVFPHQLVRLILSEQLYRANTIRRGEPYHHH
jgi:23S rRNA (pseudouridine1915-N3)-methyltransferase